MQKKEPFVIIRGDATEIIEGKASEVIADPNLMHIIHLDCEKVVAYLREYKDVSFAREPRNNWLTLKHRDMNGGSVAMNRLTPIITERQWKTRDKARILDLYDKIVQHIEKRRNINVDLERKILVCLFLFRFFFVFVFFFFF